MINSLFQWKHSKNICKSFFLSLTFCFLSLVLGEWFTAQNLTEFQNKLEREKKKERKRIYLCLCLKQAFLNLLLLSWIIFCYAKLAFQDSNCFKNLGMFITAFVHFWLCYGILWISSTLLSAFDDTSTFWLDFAILHFEEMSKVDKHFYFHWVNSLQFLLIFSSCLGWCWSRSLS